ncbi:hypothetical protein QE152_g26226 [Popillia japonica]|uniref:Uncharacterized protein n=1 Tax=Popillia japonica TaxID=7064 RepID=A0AAW1JZF1_POPJA
MKGKHCIKNEIGNPLLRARERWVFFCLPTDGFGSNSARVEASTKTASKHRQHGCDSYRNAKLSTQVSWGQQMRSTLKMKGKHCIKNEIGGPLLRARKRWIFFCLATDRFGSNSARVEASTKTASKHRQHSRKAKLST